MSKAQEIVGREPPARIYHYTNQRGLIGIIQSKKIWASNIHYLNDYSEFTHAIELVKHRIRVMLSRGNFSEDNDDAKQLRTIDRHIDSIKDISVCVTAFSEDGDSLSQWRGYCIDSLGFSIGFDSVKLRDIAKSQGFVLYPCIYERRDQELFVDELLYASLARYVQLNPEMKTNQNLVETLANEFVNQFTLLAPIMKNSAFSEEKEWRIISNIFEISFPPKFKVRVGAAVPIPYLEVCLTDVGHTLPISEVIVGPTPHMEAAMNSVTTLLSDEKGRLQWNVGRSLIPYRNW